MTPPLRKRDTDAATQRLLTLGWGTRYRRGLVVAGRDRCCAVRAPFQREEVPGRKWGRCAVTYRSAGKGGASTGVIRACWRTGDGGGLRREVSRRLSALLSNNWLRLTRCSCIVSPISKDCTLSQERVLLPGRPPAHRGPRSWRRDDCVLSSAQPLRDSGRFQLPSASHSLKLIRLSRLRHLSECRRLRAARAIPH